MEVFEDASANEDYVDDTSRLFCTITNSRNIDGHTEYILRIQRGYNEDSSWTVFKRYSEFADLHRNLRATYYDINLPPKKFFGNLDRQFIRERQQKLQSYINKVLDHIVLSSSYHLKQFLDPVHYHAVKQENGFQDASMAVRGKTDFHNMKPLPEIGWRFNKQYCSVKKLNERREYIVTWIGRYGMRTCLTDKELRSAFKVLLELMHSFIVPITAGSFHSKGAMLIRSSCIKGSLRECIRQKSPFDSFLYKCQYGGDERLYLPSVQVSTISLQVLNALSFLHDKNIPYGNLHTGNIFIEDNVAKISDLENGIFGLPSFYRRYLIENRRVRSLEDVDVYLYGHVLYEMVFGTRLDSCFCDSELLDCYENLRPILRLLLSSSLDNELPSIDQLLATNAFSSGSCKLKHEIPPRCKLTSTTKEIMLKSKRYIENTLTKDQNELRKHRKIVRLQEEVELAEKYDCAVVKFKDNRQVKKSNRSNIRTTNCDNLENMSNSSTHTSLSTDSSSPNSGCEKSNEINGWKATPDSSGTCSTFSEWNSRSEFLQSIINFNKGKLKKTSSHVS